MFHKQEVEVTLLTSTRARRSRRGHFNRTECLTFGDGNMQKKKGCAVQLKSLASVGHHGSEMNDGRTRQMCRFPLNSGKASSFLLECLLIGQQSAKHPSIHHVTL